MTVFEQVGCEEAYGPAVAAGNRTVGSRLKLGCHDGMSM
jgi:hypothetical protein